MAIFFRLDTECLLVKGNEYKILMCVLTSVCLLNDNQLKKTTKTSGNVVHAGHTTHFCAASGFFFQRDEVFSFDLR